MGCHASALRGLPGPPNAAVTGRKRALGPLTPDSCAAAGDCRSGGSFRSCQSLPGVGPCACGGSVFSVSGATAGQPCSETEDECACVAGITLHVGHGGSGSDGPEVVMEPHSHGATNVNCKRGAICASGRRCSVSTVSTGVSTVMGHSSSFQNMLHHVSSHATMMTRASANSLAPRAGSDDELDQLIEEEEATVGDHVIDDGASEYDGDSSDSEIGLYGVEEVGVDGVPREAGAGSAEAGSTEAVGNGVSAGDGSQDHDDGSESESDSDSDSDCDAHSVHQVVTVPLAGTAAPASVSPSTQAASVGAVQSPPASARRLRPMSGSWSSSRRVVSHQAPHVTARVLQRHGSMDDAVHRSCGPVNAQDGVASYRRSVTTVGAADGSNASPVPHHGHVGFRYEVPQQPWSRRRWSAYVYTHSRVHSSPQPWYAGAVGAYGGHGSAPRPSAPHDGHGVKATDPDGDSALKCWAQGHRARRAVVVRSLSTMYDEA